MYSEYSRKQMSIYLKEEHAEMSLILFKSKKPICPEQMSTSLR